MYSKEKIDGSRACLVVVETIAEVENVKAYLENAGYNKKQIFVYGTGSANEYKVEKRTLQVGDVSLQLIWQGEVLT